VWSFKKFLNYNNKTPLSTNKTLQTKLECNLPNHLSTGHLRYRPTESGASRTSELASIHTSVSYKCIYKNTEIFTLNLTNCWMMRRTEYIFPSSSINQQVSNIHKLSQLIWHLWATAYTQIQKPVTKRHNNRCFTIVLNELH
jgi:hypothetical protein